MQQQQQLGLVCLTSPTCATRISYRTLRKASVTPHALASVYRDDVRNLENDDEIRFYFFNLMQLSLFEIAWYGHEHGQLSDEYFESWVKRFRIIAAEPMLSQADRDLGDGDHGMGMERGMRAATEKLNAGEPESIEKAFSTVGMAMMSSMGGASGAIFGTFFRNGGKALNGKDAFDAAELAAFLKAGVDGLEVLGLFRLQVGFIGHADGEEESAGYVQPDQPHTVLAGFDHHEGRDGQTQHQDVRGDVPRRGVDPCVVPEVAEEGDDPVVGVGDGLGPRRDQRDYGDHGVDAAQQFAGCGHHEKLGRFRRVFAVMTTLGQYPPMPVAGPAASTP